MRIGRGRQDTYNPIQKRRMDPIGCLQHTNQYAILWQLELTTGKRGVISSESVADGMIAAGQTDERFRTKLLISSQSNLLINDEAIVVTHPRGNWAAKSQQLHGARGQTKDLTAVAPVIPAKSTRISISDFLICPYAECESSCEIDQGLRNR